jgi:predicted transcriptional regulator
MRSETALVLDDHDEAVARLFIELGLSRPVAKTLVFLSHSLEAVSSEIEQGTNLRQPEVSVAMQEIRRRGWADKRDLKRAGKGRPVHAYRLTTPLTTVVSELEADARRAMERSEEAIQRLRKMLP